jgi:tetratricopeptide (TPR) repeat protein
VALFCLMFILPSRLPGQEVGEPKEIPAGADSSGSNDTLRAYLQIQEQLHATQLAIERTRHQAEESITRNAETVATRLRDVEQQLSAQRAREEALTQNAGTMSAQHDKEVRFLVYTLGSFGAFSFLAVIVISYFQWRTVRQLADLATSLPASRMIGSSSGGSPGYGESVPLGSIQIEQTSNRLLSAVERLEKRILELEDAATPPLSGVTTGPEGDSGASKKLPVAAPPEAIASIESDQETQIKEWLERGQTFLNADNPEAAVDAFDQILGMASEHTEALVKKGAALEKLRKFTEAIECYDRAIAADDSMTIAYLHKGGLYNRLERFGEAVECYEKALRTQERRSAA